MSLTLVILLSFTFFSCRKRVNVKTVNASKLLERQEELALKEIEKTKMVSYSNSFIFSEEENFRPFLI